jgi:hypothetical protein
MAIARKKTHAHVHHGLFDLMPSAEKFKSCTFRKSDSRITVRDEDKNTVGVIQLSGSTKHARCVIWRAHRLVGQCAFEPETGWFVYPIKRGFLAPEPLTNTDPLEYLIGLGGLSDRTNGAEHAGKGVEDSGITFFRSVDQT